MRLAQVNPPLLVLFLHLHEAELPLFAAEENSSQFESHHSTSTIRPGPSASLTAPTDDNESEYTASGRRKFPSELKTIPCTVAGCTKKFNRPARLVAHLRSHNNERPYKCTYEGCEKSYTDNKHLRSHVLSAHTEDAAFQFVCDTCGARFATGQRLKRHGLTHQGAERYRCRDYPPCTQSFRKHHTLQRHILKDHLGQKPFQCTHAGCPEAYDTANALTAHANREHGEPRFWCDECAKAAEDEPESPKPAGFTTMFLLEQHIRHEHVNCIFCDGIKFGGQYELEKHMEVYHSGLTVKDRKTVPCDFPGCDKRFVKKSNMKAHYRSAHEGVRVICGQLNTWDSPGLEDWNWTEEGCGQTFTNKAALEHHVRHVHLGKKRPRYDGPVKAPVPADADHLYDYAGKADLLNEISGVTEHERRPLPCMVTDCTARFIRHADLREHMQAEHPEMLHVALFEVDEMPQADWANNEGTEWDAEDANVMQLLNLDGAIDPTLLVEA